MRDAEPSLKSDADAKASIHCNHSVTLTFNRVNPKMLFSGATY